MAPVAIDIVLRPDEGMVRQAIAWNRMLRQDADAIVLGKVDRVPHLSLGMAVVSSDDLTQVIDAVSAFTGIKDISLATDGIKEVERDGKVNVSLGFYQNTVLRDLHLQAIELLRPYALRCEEENALFRPGRFAASSLAYINDFIEKYSGDNYSPHITLGYGRIGAVFSDIEVKFEGIEVYQLGDHCTCRRKVCGLSDQI